MEFKHLKISYTGFRGFRHNINKITSSNFFNTKLGKLKVVNFQ